MAERRMFAKTIIDSDAFLDMPLSTQCLYFHLSMRADDDGFINNPRKIQKMISCNDDDLKLLISKRFIIPFESGIVVIKHWKLHNYIQKDRYKETVYQDEKNLLDVKENKAYTLKSEVFKMLDTECLQDGYSLETQVRLGKDSIDKSIKDITPSKPKKIKYGEFEKVSLLEEEYQKLIEKLGQAVTNDFISRLDNYKASTGKQYKSDYATILNWQRKEPIKTDKPQQKPNSFHNFDQKIGKKTEADLEEIAARKREKFRM
jgi:hypothetical protein